MRRGDVVLVEFDPVVGNEQGKTRPAVVVSNDSANRVASSTGRGVVSVVPITSNVQDVQSFQALIRPGTSGLVRPGKAQGEQVRAVSPRRMVRKLGALDAEAMAAIDEALRIQLAL